ncbi:hypothetical protein MG293_000848 [Ovis ammon polii]|uniref:Uncharacterized protein n=1 Tax=Ovis ammon polii TaxID=230172 RepID=A0AAD4YHN7_OVIAM|nr:hypothetical protein MG293_000848 [Ovis ammon polii]
MQDSEKLPGLRVYRRCELSLVSINVYSKADFIYEVMKTSIAFESESEVTQYRTLCDPVDCSPPGSCVHGILQARVLEWVAVSFTSGSS